MTTENKICIPRYKIHNLPLYQLYTGWNKKRNCLELFACSVDLTKKHEIKHKNKFYIKSIEYIGKDKLILPSQPHPFFSISLQDLEKVISNTESREVYDRSSLYPTSNPEKNKEMEYWNIKQDYQAYINSFFIGTLFPGILGKCHEDREERIKGVGRGWEYQIQFYDITVGRKLKV